jgi:hypothetical protein
MTQALLLTKTKGGINRQQIVGSPPAASLYDLLNGYLSRPGARSTHNLPVGLTKGFCAFNNEFVVFSTALQTVPAGVTCEVLIHPTNAGAALKTIHFAGPFLRFLYVAAEFVTGEVFHYWLQRQSDWTANTIYQLGDLVEPTVPNGFIYQALRLGAPNQLWSADAPRTLGDVVEPTTADGYYYTVVDTDGATPRSGSTEPVWNAEDGALTYEDVDTSTPTNPGTGPVTPPTTPVPDVTDRYNNPGGSRPSGSTGSQIEP